MYIFNENIYVVTQQNGWYIFHCFHFISHMPIKYLQQFLKYSLSLSLSLFQSLSLSLCVCVCVCVCLCVFIEQTGKHNPE